MNPVLQFLYDLNQSCGNLLVFSVALWALLYAKREYGSKNLPVFGVQADIFYRSIDAILTLKVENKSNGPIKTEIEEAKIEDRDASSALKVSRFAILHARESHSVHLKLWSREEIQRLQLPPGDGSQPESVLLSVRIRSVSIEDSHKGFMTTLVMKIWFYSSETVATEIVKYDVQKT